MGTNPNDPDAPQHVEFDGGTLPRWIPISLAALLGLSGFGLYAGFRTRSDFQAEMAKTNQRADLLQKQVEQANERLAELRGELQVTSDKLGLTQEELAKARALAQNIRKEQKATGAQLTSQLGQLKQESAAQFGKVATEVSGAKSDIEATRMDLEATKGKLERTIGDLGVQSGLIARNREELDELKRRGERNIFEFDLRRSKERQRVGPILVALRKVDTKKFRYTLDVYADDKLIQKKDKTVNEPVQFYVRGVRAPYEIVVYDVHKDRAVGYLTTPKDQAVRQ